jgi:hypothetical protein
MAYLPPWVWICKWQISGELRRHVADLQHFFADSNEVAGGCGKFSTLLFSEIGNRSRINSSPIYLLYVAAKTKMPTLYRPDGES